MNYAEESKRSIPVRGSAGKEKIDEAIQIPNELVDPETGIKYMVQEWNAKVTTSDFVHVECTILPCLPPTTIKSSIDLTEGVENSTYIATISGAVYEDGTGEIDRWIKDH